MADRKKHDTLSVKATDGDCSECRASLRISVTSPAGAAVLRLIYDAEAISWDSGL